MTFNLHNMNAETQNDYILALVDAGLSIIPIAEGKKNPHPILGKQHNLLTCQSTKAEVEKWLAAGVTSWAIAGGAVSGNLSTLDFDEKHYPGLFKLWYDRLTADQRAVIDTLPRSSTRNKGTHLRCRTKTPQPTVKLARRVEFNKETQKEEIVTTAETKAEGGYALIPPSAGYAMIQGDLTDIPVISDKMYEELIDALCTFNEVEDEPATEYEWKLGESVSGDRPGDRFNATATWEAGLEPHGWVQESKNHWRRPGKKEGEGISATTDHAGIPMFYVFSTAAAPFTANKGVSKFHAFALLSHGGDFKAAAKAASEMYPPVECNWEEVFNGDALEAMRNDTPTKAAEKLMQSMPEEKWPLSFELFNTWNTKYAKSPLRMSDLKRIWKNIERAEKMSRNQKKKESLKLPPRERIAKCPAPEKAVTFEEWRNTITENFPDLRFASEVALSTVSQFLIKDITNPFALVLVDAPSSGKTIAINFFDDIPELTYATDKFT